MKKANQFEIWIADLNPRIGTEPGKRRPVVILQTNLLNENSHPSTIIYPLTTNIQPKSKILRVYIKGNQFGLNEDCDIMIDQIRAIDNQRLVKKTRKLTKNYQKKILRNLEILLDI